MFDANTVRGEELVRRSSVAVPPGQARVLTFQFDVAPFATNGSTFCTRVFLGATPAPLTNVAREGRLFCMRTGLDAVSPLPDREAAELFSRFED